MFYLYGFLVVVAVTSILALILRRVLVDEEGTLGEGNIQDDKNDGTNQPSQAFVRSKLHHHTSGGWFRDAKLVCKKFIRSTNRSFATQNWQLNRNGQMIRRRHSSSGPLNFARAAKNLLIHGPRLYKLDAKLNRSALPRPPDEFFEPSELPNMPENLTPETFYILKCFKMLELPSDCTVNLSEIISKTYDQGESIVKPGDPDDSIIVVLDGVIGVYIKHGEKKEILVRSVCAGHSFISSLSLLQILLNAGNKFHNIVVRALIDCRIAKYQMHNFRESFSKDAAAWVRTIQIATTRILHVAMTTAYQYFGLSDELLKSVKGRRSLTTTSAGSCFSYKNSDFNTKLGNDINVDFQCSDDYKVKGILGFVEALCLIGDIETYRFLNSRVQIETVQQEQILQRQDVADGRLIMLLDGILRIFKDQVDDEDCGDDRICHLIYPGELYGSLELITNEPPFYSLHSHTQSVIAFITKIDFFELINIRPVVILHASNLIVRRLSRFVKCIDSAIDQILLDPGQAIYRSGEMGDSIFLVLSGRLRSVENQQVIEEYGRGDMFGMAEVLQHAPRATTVLATRFSHVALVSEGLLNYVKLKYPQVGFTLIRLLGRCYASALKRSVPKAIFSDRLSRSTGDPRSHIKNLRTIAVIAASDDVPIVAFTCELFHALNAHIKVLRLSSQKAFRMIEADAHFHNGSDFRLMNWLNMQEDIYPLIIYECDEGPTSWTQKCIQQADAILLVALGDKAPIKEQFMEEYLKMNQDGIRTNKQLILLWNEATVRPKGTMEWLKHNWFSGHHHIRAPKRMFQWSKQKEMEMGAVDYYEHNVFTCPVDARSDFSRLGRILTDNAIGLALGGGGARGISHIGILRVLDEYGIPIDMIAGTSIGSLIGGLRAESEDVTSRANKFFKSMCSIWANIWDLTYAHTAMFTGASFNQIIHDVFLDTQIEDLWIPFFCVSTDISSSEARIHRSGPLWAYCRASMSLAGYLPPLCDPLDGHLLLDGGYVNNLPANLMKSVGAKFVIAVDVGSADEKDLYNYGSSLSGFWVLLKNLFSFGKPVKILSMAEIQSRLAYVSCVQQLELVKRAPYCFYIRPELGHIKTFDFHRSAEIEKIGHDYGMTIIMDLIRTNELIQNFVNVTKLRKASPLSGKILRISDFDCSRASSFTNLAAQLSKVPKKTIEDAKRSVYDDSSDDDGGCMVRPGSKQFLNSVASNGYSSEPCTSRNHFDENLEDMLEVHAASEKENVYE